MLYRGRQSAYIESFKVTRSRVDEGIYDFDVLVFREEAYESL